MFIIRMGKDNINTYFPDLIKEIEDLDYKIIWMCDPMHGNTKIKDGIKFRNFDDIYSELSSFIKICHSEGINPGGLHLEITSDDVTECVGGMIDVCEEDLKRRYTSKVDPRLNASQSLELIYRVSEKLKLNV